MISLRDVVTGFGNRDPLAEVWRRDLRGGGSSAEITGTLPLSFSGRGKPLTDYLISGNTVQDGTPSPEAPVDVLGCGVRTGNLFDAATAYGSMYDSDTGVLAGAASTLTAMKNKFASSMVGMPITISIRAYDVPVTRVYIRCTIGGTNIDSNSIANGKTGTMTVTVTPISVNDEWRITFGTGVGVLTLSNIMLNSGSTALPYEPYGYKLPLTVNGTEYPIYLGQVETTRRIRKLVLTGEENWRVQYGGHTLSISKIGELYSTLSTHYIPSISTSTDKSIYVASTHVIIVCDRDYTTTKDFKSYLAAQYQNGTPVTVWYVLAKPETAVVNEPLHKMGDYADTISFAQAGVAIPTVNGENVLDMTSHVKPSEVYIKGKGIKPTNNPNFENGG